MSPALDPDPESDFPIFGDSGSGFVSSIKRNRNIGVMIGTMDTNQSYFQPFAAS